MAKSVSRHLKAPRILVPLDGSPVGERALSYLERVAGRAGSEVLLLQVVASVNPAPLVPKYGPSPVEVLETRRQRAEAYLERVRRGLQRRGITARVMVRSGDPAEEILACASTQGADLVLMSTHGRSGVRRVLMGSVAESVLRKSSLPVLLIPSRIAPATRRRPA